MLQIKKKEWQKIVQRKKKSVAIKILFFRRFDGSGQSVQTKKKDLKRPNYGLKFGNTIARDCVRIAEEYFAFYFEIRIKKT